MSLAASARNLHTRQRLSSPVASRIFIAAPVPEAAIHVLTKASQYYANSITTNIPSKKWHVTLAFLGDVAHIDQHLQAITEPISSEYVPVATVTHLGPGKAPNQLWAYIHTTPVLTDIRTTILERLNKAGLHVDTRAFTPHISLAHTEKLATIPETPCSLTFPVKQLHVFESVSQGSTTTYASRAEIRLTP